MQNFDVNSLKAAILKPAPVVVKTEIFGPTVYLKRLTAEYLIGYDEAMADMKDENSPRKSSETLAQLIIDSLVLPDGSEIPEEKKPTAKEILAVHDNKAILEASQKVQKHCVGTLESATKN